MLEKIASACKAVSLETFCYIKLQTIIFLSVCGIYMFQLGYSTCYSYTGRLVAQLLKQLHKSDMNIPAWKCLHRLQLKGVNAVFWAEVYSKLSILTLYMKTKLNLIKVYMLRAFEKETEKQPSNTA